MKNSQHQQSQRPLKGIKVVDLGLWIAGPAAAATLADWGADVIKVEPASGDPARNALASILGIENMRSPAFELDNRGKRSIVLDLVSDADKDIFYGLLEDADVFVTNLRPNALEKLGITPEQLQIKFPKLVIAQVTGYGNSGPDRDRPGYDSGAFWAYSGLAHQFSGETGYPPILPAAFGDHLTAITLVSGISSALFDRSRTGKGCIVETSLLKVGIYAASCDYAMRMEFGRSRPPQKRNTSESPLVNSYRTSDGKYLWLLCVEAGRHWPSLMKAIGHAELIDDPRFKKTRSRHENRETLISTLDNIFSLKTRDEWSEILDKHEIWWSPVNTLEEVLENEQIDHVNAFIDIPKGAHQDKPMRSVASPITFNRSPDSIQRSSPELGEHNEQIRKELGIKNRLSKQ